jgi:DNA-binding NarL/FixJ family response regulator
MMTGQLEASHVLEARAAGVTGYVAKPVTVQGMMAHLVDIINAVAPVHYG